MSKGPTLHTYTSEIPFRAGGQAKLINPTRKDRRVEITTRTEGVVEVRADPRAHNHRCGQSRRRSPRVHDSLKPLPKTSPGFSRATASLTATTSARASKARTDPPAAAILPQDWTDRRLSRTHTPTDHTRNKGPTTLCAFSALHCALRAGPRRDQRRDLCAAEEPCGLSIPVERYT